MSHFILDLMTSVHTRLLQTGFDPSNFEQKTELLRTTEQEGAHVPVNFLADNTQHVISSPINLFVLVFV